MYLLYRWVLVVYFLTWFLFDTIYEGPMIFIYITNWTYIVWCAYLTLSLVSTLVGVCQTYDVFMRSGVDNRKEEMLEIAQSLKSSTIDDQGHKHIKWFHKLQWVLYNVAIVNTFFVAVLYWALILPTSSDMTVTIINVQFHGIDTVIAAIDLAVTGIVMKWSHYVYPLLFNLSYIIWNVI